MRRAHTIPLRWEKLMHSPATYLTTEIDLTHSQSTHHSFRAPFCSLSSADKGTREKKMKKMEKSVCCQYCSAKWLSTSVRAYEFHCLMFIRFRVGLGRIEIERNQSNRFECAELINDDNETMFGLFRHLGDSAAKWSAPPNLLPHWEC